MVEEGDIVGFLEDHPGIIESSRPGEDEEGFFL